MRPQGFLLPKRLPARQPVCEYIYTCPAVRCNGDTCGNKLLLLFIKRAGLHGFFMQHHKGFNGFRYMLGYFLICLHEILEKNLSIIFYCIPPSLL